MKEMNKNNKGITLIALVITIIVLLILAGVTINLTLGKNGIFTTAQKAAKNYTNAQEKELAELGEFTNLVNDTIKEQGNGEGGASTPEQKVTEISLNKTSTTIDLKGTETLTATIEPEDAVNKNLTWTSSDESIATVENGIITATGEGTATISATAQDGSGVSVSCTVTVNKVNLSVVAKPGDYVAYDGGNGYTGLWQVLYNDDTYGLQIISADIVIDSFTLGGSTEEEAKSSYNSAVDTLNTECRKYVNTSYATSGRCVGSDPLNPDDAITETVTLSFTYNGTTESGFKVGDTNYETDYYAMQSATNQSTSGIVGSCYWLASRRVSSNSLLAQFSMWVVSLR